MKLNKQQRENYNKLFSKYKKMFDLTPDNREARDIYYTLLNKGLELVRLQKKYEKKKKELLNYLYEITYR